MNAMNLAQMLSERMKSPGAMGEFKDRTDQPAAMAGVGDGSTGGDKQEPFPLDTQGASDGVLPDNPGQPVSGDGGLGMLSSAHAGAHGKLKERYAKAIAHGKAKHGKHGKK